MKKKSDFNTFIYLYNLNRYAQCYNMIKFYTPICLCEALFIDRMDRIPLTTDENLPCTSPKNLHRVIISSNVYQQL